MLADQQRDERLAVTSERRIDASVLCRTALGQIGSMSKRIWMSTGIFDVDVTPAYVESISSQIKQVRQSARQAVAIMLLAAG